MFTKLARLGVGLAAMVLAGTTFALAETSATPASTKVAQASPAPSASPNPFSYRGYVRAYDFTRQNAYSGHSAVNQQSFNAAISLHGDYMFSNTGFDIGASYLYANPLSNCTSAQSHLTPPCGANKAPDTNPDDTLPGFELSTLYEAYLQYKSPELYFKGGNLVTPGYQVWTPASDSRVKPVAFRGAYANYTLNKEFTIEAGDYWQWECRTCSDFNNQTLLTDNNVSFPYPGATGLSTLYFAPGLSGIPTSGVFFARASYAGTKTLPLTASVTYLGFNQIANAVWVDGRYPFAGKLKPYVALQFGSEGNPSNGVIGKISSTVFGLQGGINVLSNVQFVAGFDTLPVHNDTLSAAQMASGGAVCTKTGTVALAPGAKAYNVNFPYFLPTGGTGNCKLNADGSTSIFYGGWASPYTDSYASDPFFSTSMTQGMVDRRSPGTGTKVQLTYTSDDKRLVSYITHAWYDYNNGAYDNSTQETDFDALYYFSHVPKTGPYHGFSFRYRYGERDSAPTFTGGTPVGLFKYNRFQAEYDF